MSRKVQSNKLPSESPSPSRRVSLLKPDFWPARKPSNNLAHHRESLTRRVDFLEAEVKRLNGVIRYKNRTLQYEVEFLSEYLRGPCEVSYEALKRRISILKGAIERIRGGLEDEL